MADTNITTPAGTTPEDNNTNTNTNTNTYDTNTDYIAVIEEMKVNTVPRTDFEKLQEEKKRLLETLVKGGQVETPPTGPTQQDINTWAATLTAGNCVYSDLELAKASLNLRNACLELGMPDQYVRQGKNIKPTQEDINAGEATAKALRESIEAANGDNRKFCQELEARLADTGLPNIPSGRKYF